MARKPTLNALHSKRLAAIDVFSKAANDLLSTAGDYRDLADDARSVADVHTELATEATLAAISAENQAAKIRELLG